MRLIVRKHGSQRTSKPQALSIEPNWAGESEAVLTFKTEDGRYLRVIPESQADMKELLSAVHIVAHNFKGE